MSITIAEIVKSFDLLYNSMHRKEFSKTLRLNEWGEQELLPLVRTFLLGYFGESLVPEAKSKLPGALSGHGRIDLKFLIRKCLNFNWKIMILCLIGITRFRQQKCEVIYC
jgi:hypothetical protein